jgi:hypothetical protein
LGWGVYDVEEGVEEQMLDPGSWILDADEILDDFIPICRQEGGVSFGNTRYWIPDVGCGMRDARYAIQDAGQIMEDLIPTSREDGGVSVGNARFGIMKLNIVIPAKASR